jgi:UDP-N-acetyl-D-glucosamine dehydrogenase
MSRTFNASEELTPYTWHLLSQRGATITYSDLYVPGVKLDGLEMRASDPGDMAETADCVIIVTDHTSFDHPAILERARLIVDIRKRCDRSAKIVRL